MLGILEFVFSSAAVWIGTVLPLILIVSLLSQWQPIKIHINVNNHRPGDDS